MGNYCYKFKSCETDKYNDITNICSDSPLIDVNKFVYLAGGDPNEIYEIILVGENACICEREIPPYIISKKTCTGEQNFTIKNCKTGETKDVELVGNTINIIDKVIKVLESRDCWNVLSISNINTETFNIIEILGSCVECAETKQYFTIENCKTKETKDVELVGVVGNILGKVLKFTESQNNECWKVLQQVLSGTDVYTISSILNDCTPCVPIVLGDCKEDGERTIAYATMIRLPEPSIPDKGFKECCYTNLVLADESDANPHKNDFNGFYFKKQTAGDDCEFILHQLSTGDTFALNSNIYGMFKDFGTINNNLDLTTYIVEWRKVLAILGTGLYQVEKALTVAGINISIMSNTFTLDRYSDERADKTIRIDTLMDGKMVNLDINFKGSEFKTSVRTYGFFGRRNPKYKQDNLVKRNYKVEQISMSLENEYQMQSGLLPECITEEIYDFILFGNELFISDYNLINHSYKYRLKPVELATNKGAKYYTTNRNGRINLTFKDRIKNKRKINC